MDGRLTAAELIEVLRPLLTRELGGYGFTLVIESAEPDGSTRIDFVSNRDPDRLAQVLRKLTDGLGRKAAGRVALRSTGTIQ